MKDWLKQIANIAPLLPSGISATKLLDTGGQGAVYLGTVAGTNAAIKIYWPGSTEKRIEREIQALLTIKCPQLVSLLWHGTITAQGQSAHVVATEFIEGRPLHDRLAGGTPIPHAELRPIVRDIAKAIEAIWQERIVHRDIKPANVLVRPDGTARLIDLGLARHLEESSITAIGHTGGTQGYLSPEQCNGVRSLTCNSDIYALGVMLVECALGRHPSGRNQQLLIASDLHTHLPQPVASWPEYPLVQKMLNPAAYRRPSPADLVRAFS